MYSFGVFLYTVFNKSQQDVLVLFFFDFANISVAVDGKHLYKCLKIKARSGKYKSLK